MTIPASKLVAVFPGVLTAGGAAVALSGLILTNNTAVPIGSVQSFASPADVAKFFGDTSDEYNLSAVYFAGYDNSTAKPGALLFSQYASTAVAGYLRSGSFAGEPLTTVTGIASGTLTVSVDGVAKTSTAINLSTATSYSNAATIIQAAFTGGGAPVVTYDAQRQAFVFASPTTGAASAVSYGSGALSAGLRLTAATAAQLSSGSAVMTPAPALLAVTARALNWASFMTTFEPTVDEKIAFATWTSQQNNRFSYVAWDTDPNALVQGNTTNFGARVAAVGLSGSLPVTGDASVAAALGVSLASIVRPLAAFAMGIAASLDFTTTNGRQTFAFRSQGGLTPSVMDATAGDTLIANGYNFYGAYATSAQQFRFMQPGQISGAFKWADSYYNQIWMNSAFQQSLMVLMTGAGTIPYNNFGYSQIESSLADPIAAALNFGAIRAGVTLGSDQIASINASVGKKIADVVSTRGWYLNIADPGAAVRVARGSPDMTFFYADGGSVQKIELASINVQ